MSGAHVNWTPEMRAAKSAHMKALNARMRTDEELKARCVAGQKRFRRSPMARAIASAEMKKKMQRPEMRRAARYHCIKINKNQKVRRRQWATRRRRKKARQQ